MSGKLNRDKGQSSFCVIMAHLTGSSGGTQFEVVLRVVRYVKFIELRWWDCEALSAVEGHILDCKQCSVVDQDHIENAVADNGAVGPLNHARKNTQSRRK